MPLAFDLLLWVGVPLALFLGWAVRQPVGTRSVLYGAHCWCIHPWFVAAGWWRLFKFRRVTCPSSGVTTSLLDWRLWLAFFVHDLGYWKCLNMDGEEGEAHPKWGAQFLNRRADLRSISSSKWHEGWWRHWHDFSLYHSRYLAKQAGKAPSLLCYADKLAVAFEPWWLYLPRVIATGEVREYIALAEKGKYADSLNTERIRASLGSLISWHGAMTAWCRDWALEHYDGRADTWTPEQSRKGVA